MSETETRPPSGPATYPAAKARQGEIILRRPWQRWVFIAGLAGAGVLAVLLAVAGR